MADELEKKPKPIGTPAPNIQKPKQEPVSNPAPKLDRQKSASLGKVRVQPGSPNMPESVPVGVQQTKHESSKHLDKRVNKMFKDTNQPTLGIWNKNNTNPMAKPDKVRFNPNLNYKPSKEALEAANRKKIMNAGFAPKNWDGISDVEEPAPISANQKYEDWKQKGLKTWNQKLQKGDKIKFKGRDGNDIEGYIGGFWKNQQLQDDDTYEEGVDNLWHDFRSIGLVDKDGKTLGNINASQILEHSREEPKPNKNYVKENGMIKVIDENGNPTGEQYPSQESAEDINTSIDNWNEVESKQRSKASELFGTDLNKQQGYDYDRLAQELDSGEWTGLDANLIGSDYGYNNLNENQNLAADARKNPETGKYEVSIYPVSENGPLPGYEPEENEPTYEFDSFDDLKAFMENGYKKVEQPKWDKHNDPGSVITTKELENFVKDYMKKDGGLNDNFIDAYVSNLYKDSRKADFWKQKMKEDWEKKYGGNK